MGCCQSYGPLLGPLNTKDSRKEHDFDSYPYTLTSKVPRNQRPILYSLGLRAFFLGTLEIQAMLQNVVAWGMLEYTFTSRQG